MTNLLFWIIKHRITHDHMKNIQWYREKVGGFWCHSQVMGWEQILNLESINACLNHYRIEPELYDHGRQIEDYRPTPD